MGCMVQVLQNFDREKIVCVHYILEYGSADFSVKGQIAFYTLWAPLSLLHLFSSAVVV